MAIRNRSQTQSQILPKPKFYLLWLVLLLTGFQLLATAAEEEFFHLKPEDEIKTKDGRILKGRIMDTGDKTRIRIQDRMGRSVELDADRDIEELHRQATPDSELARLAKEYAGNAPRLVMVAREGLRRFTNLDAKILKMLESASSSQDPELLELLAERYLAAGNVVSAESNARALIARKNSANAQRLLGSALAAQGKTADADAALSQALKLAPDQEEIMVARAAFLLSTGKPEEARQIFSDALSKNPKMISALVGQGQVHLRQGEMVDAAQSFQKALEIDSNHLRAKTGLAVCKAMGKEGDEAYRLAEEVLSFDNRNATAFGIQGYARLFSGEIDKLPQALQKIEESLRENPADPRMWVVKAVALDRAAQVDEGNGKASEAASKRALSAKLLSDAVTASPPDSYLQFLFGELHYKKGELDAALAKFKKAAELAPRYAPARQAVGALALKLRKWEEAAAAYKAALDIDSNKAEYHAGLGLALLGMKRLEEAQAGLKKARDLDPNNTPALCGLGYIANFERNETSARNFFQQALTADGHCSYAAEALKKMYSQRDMQLDYLTFDEKDPPGWSAKGGRQIKASVANGRVQWKGTQGGATSEKMEYLTAINANDFVRLEADLEIPPDSPSTLGLRIGSRAGSAVNFEVEFGKDNAGHVAYRFRDYSGQPPDWHVLEAWPSNGKARLGIEGVDLDAGRFRLFCNGSDKGTLPLQLKKPGKISAGMFAQAAPKEALDAKADNVALLMHKGGGDEDHSRMGDLIPPEEKKEPAPETK